MRGEKSGNGGYTWKDQGSPPRARGKELPVIEEQLRTGITPACAGKSPEDKIRKITGRDHPRVRGEKTVV